MNRLGLCVWIALSRVSVTISAAQTAVVEGAVSTESLHKHSVPGVEISIPALKFTTHTKIGAVEFYPGGASLPAEFNRTSSGCGALLLWTQEK